MGMATASPTMQDQIGFSGHLVYRSRIFSELGLQPYFPTGRYDHNIRSMFRDKAGKLYKYYDDGNLQQLLDADGQALYGRVDGLKRVATKLILPNWPLSAEGEIFGLDPKCSYALFPKTKEASTALRISTLADGVNLGKYCETPDGVVLELRSSSGSMSNISTTIEFPKDFEHVFVNDQEIPFHRSLAVNAKLPLRLHAVTKNIECQFDKQFPEPLTARSISKSSGMVDASVTPSIVTHPVEGRALRFMVYNNSQVEFPLQVVSDDLSMVVYVKSDSSRLPHPTGIEYYYGNGTVARMFINGKAVREFDCCPNCVPTKKAPIDTAMRKWVIPLGAYKGQTVWVTLESDMKNDPTGDVQFWSIPYLIHDAAQQYVEQVVAEPKPPKKLDVVDGEIKLSFDDLDDNSLGEGEKIDAQNAWQGKGCLAIAGNGKYKLKALAMNLKPNKKYNISMFLKKTENASKGHPSVGVFNILKDNTMEKYGCWSAANDNLWHEVKGSFQTTDKAGQVILYLYNVNAQGTAFFDEIVIKEAN
jgi:hypothetical protein